jgi:hypothetical protein
MVMPLTHHQFVGGKKMLKQIAIVSLCFYLVVSPADAAKSQIGNHVYSIWIAQGWDYGYPEDELSYEFTFGVHTDTSVESVEFLTPEGNTFPIINPTLSRGTLFWEYYASYTDVGSLADYGDGTYTVIVSYVGGGQDQTTAWFGIPRSNDYMPQPTQEPVLLVPEHGNTTTSKVTFEWQPCVDPSTNLIVLNLENTTTDKRIMMWFRPTKTEWKNAHLSIGLWEAELSFGQRYNPSHNKDGISVYVSKYSESDYMFEVVPD